MTTPNWPAFLAERLDEMERYVRANRKIRMVGLPIWKEMEEMHASVAVDDLLLADIAAKRAILDEYRELETYAVSKGIYRTPAADAAYAQLHARLEDIAILCRPFADHPDYQE